MFQVPPPTQMNFLQTDALTARPFKNFSSESSQGHLPMALHRARQVSRSRLLLFACEPVAALLLALRVCGRADRVVGLHAGAEGAADGRRGRDEPGEHEHVAVAE